MQLATSTRDARNNAIATDIGASGILEIRTGSAPANCAAADSGTVLATINMPSTPFATSSSGVMAKSGVWQDPAADASGTPGHYRLKTSGGVCKSQGTCGVGSGELQLDSAPNAGQVVTVTAFTFTDPNA